MKVNLIYDFDDLYVNGRDSFNVRATNFVYTIHTDEYKTPYSILKEKHYKDAFFEAVKQVYQNYGEFIN